MPPSIVIIAVMPSSVIAPSIVVTVPRHRGMWSWARSPRGDRAYSRVMAIVEPASSRNTSWLGFTRAAQAAKSLRRSWMRGVFRSTAQKDFFFETAPAHGPRDRESRD